MKRIDQAADSYLVTCARAGDRQAFARLVKWRGPQLYAHARRLTDSADAARDVVQDAWVEVLRGLPGLRDEHAFLPWALRIVSRRAARQMNGQIAARDLARE